MTRSDSPSAAAEKTHILVVEDEDGARGALARGLREENCAVLEAVDGVAGLRMAIDEHPDLVLLDLRLPLLDGEHLLEKLRRVSAVPVIVVSAKRGEDDRVEALNLGADDYLVKPFTIRELLARIRAVLRRKAGTVITTAMLGDIEIDFPARAVRRQGEPVPLTSLEFAVLAYLARRRGEVVSRDELAQSTHAGEVDGLPRHDIPVSNVVDVIVMRLRRKLGRGLIATRRGQGFIIDG
jgi:DNA-binding response OmpR family regulator